MEGEDMRASWPGTRRIQARALSRTLGRKVAYVAINSAAAYIPLNLVYFISAYAVHKTIVVEWMPFIITAFMVVFLFVAGSLIDLVEYAALRIALGSAWRRPPPGAVCFGRLVEFGESTVRKRGYLLGKDVEGLFALRRGRVRRLCSGPYTVVEHDRLGVYTPLILGKVMLRPYLKVDGSGGRFILDVISPKNMMEGLKYTEEAE